MAEMRLEQVAEMRLVQVTEMRLVQVAEMRLVQVAEMRLTHWNYPTHLENFGGEESGILIFCVVFMVRYKVTI